jgi:hypothetical protein
MSERHSGSACLFQFLCITAEIRIPNAKQDMENVLSVYGTYWRSIRDNRRGMEVEMARNELKERMLDGIWINHLFSLLLLC